jgi:hypothetical protein
MYHYLKWAALSLFFRRNLRYLLLLFLSVIGIFAIDAIHGDLKEFFVETGHREYLLSLLLFKWIGVLVLVGLLLFSLSRLGFSDPVRSKREEKKKGNDGKGEEGDPLMRRLEKFRGSRPLRRRSDLLVDRKKRR